MCNLSISFSYSSDDPGANSNPSQLRLMAGGPSLRGALHTRRGHTEVPPCEVHLHGRRRAKVYFANFSLEEKHHRGCRDGFRTGVCTLIARVG